jgi:signal transduction histidine kinase
MLLESLWQELTVELTPAPPLVLAVPAAVAVQADPALLALVLRNLLDNALRYSGTGLVHCLLVDTRLIVRDAGPGFTDADLGRVFDRFYVGERGMHGLGLALVRHACEASGWRVSAANAVEGGGELTVDFGAACLLPN